jgi:hypothetical protein
LLERGTVESVEGLFGSENRTTEWVVRKLAGVEEVVDQLQRLIEVHGHLLLDDLAFLGDFRVGEFGVDEHVGQHLQQVGQVMRPARARRSRCAPRR